MATTTAKRKSAASQVTITIPVLGKGEHYAGIVLADGKPSHHLILLPGELERGTWSESIAWAKKAGGELPTRQEQSILFGNAKQHFQPRWYWSAEQYAGYEAVAWVQGFGDGNQYDVLKDFTCRARAVRRLSI